MGLFNTIPNLTFFENLDNKGYYMMFLCSPETARKRYEQYTRTGRYDETGMADPYGYLELNISSPMLHTLAVENEIQGELFLTYIKQEKVVEHTEIRLAPSWGWFKFSEEIQIEKWLGEYNSYQTQKQEELLKTQSQGLQIALF